MSRLIRRFGLVCLAAAALAPAARAGVTDVAIPSSTTWAAAAINGAQIGAATTSGNTGSGLVFGNWNGNVLIVGPEGVASPDTITFGTPVALSGTSSVNALMNLLYGVNNQVDAILTFTNSLAQTDQFSLVGGQTIRDYNQNPATTNTLTGSNTNPAYGLVTAQNWWNNGGTGQRLDAQTFLLPLGWAGTDLVSVTIADPWATTATNDPVLSALQVVNQPALVPEPSAAALLGLALAGVAATRRRRSAAV